MNPIRLFFLVSVLLAAGTAQAQENLFRAASVRASSTHPKSEPQRVNDGSYLRASTWISATDSRPPHTVEMTLPFYADIDSVVIVTGIPAAEISEYERGRHDGFWCVKNILIQYWDDANWTDISETLVSENREDRVVFRLKKPVTSFSFRLFSTDGEPIRIIEFEGWGRKNPKLKAPQQGPAQTEELKRKKQRIQVCVGPQVVGESMRYVGYNQGYFIPGSNVSKWIEYAGVNSMRLWADPDVYIPDAAIDLSSKPQTLASFEKCKASLRSNSGSIDWPLIEATAAKIHQSTNTMSLEYALDELSRLGVEVLIQSSLGRKYYDLSWPNKWIVWQQFYAQAYYAAKRGNVSMYAMKNEPNHRNSGPMPLNMFLELMKVASDAVHCAVEDVNRTYGKQLNCRFVGPVTAGTNTNWWSAVAAAEGTDYAGRPTDKAIVDIFSTHSYNIPAAGYKGKVGMIDSILRRNHPKGLGKPVCFTEIGRWMNAYLIDKEETMDSPTLFTEWAGIYTQNTLEGGEGMWAFKFGNTASSTYPRGIKSGHHYMWKGSRYAESAFDNIALTAVASSHDGSDCSMVNDGDKRDASAWKAVGPGPKSIELDFKEDREIGGLAIYTGSAYGVFTAPDRVRDYKVEAYAEGMWFPLEKASVTGFRYAHNSCLFPSPVKASRLRLTFLDEGSISVREVRVFAPIDEKRIDRSFDVAGMQRTGETVRLFAKGFKDKRPLLKTTLSSPDHDLDLMASTHPQDGSIYIWVVQRNDRDYKIQLNLKDLGLKSGTKLIYERVDAAHYGSARVLRLPFWKKVWLKVPARSVGLISIKKGGKARALRPVQEASVRLNGGVEKALNVEMNYADKAGNSVAYLDFDASGKAFTNALLRLRGHSSDGELMRFHVYCIPEAGWDAASLHWDKAPCLDAHEARILPASPALFAGEVAFGEKAEEWVDLSPLVEKYALQRFTIALVRELRDPSDDEDQGRSVHIANRSKLMIW